MMGKILAIVLQLTLLYISGTYSEQGNILVYATQSAYSSFTISLTLPPDNTKEVCVQGRYGNSTQGDPNINYCSTVSFSGLQPDLCVFPGFNDLLWTWEAIDTPDDSILEVAPWNITAVENLVGPGDPQPIYGEYPPSTICCGSNSTHRLSIITTDPDNWGGPGVIASIETYIYLNAQKNGNLSEVDFILQRDECGPPLQLSSHEQGESARTLIISPQIFRNYSYGDWYLIVQPRSPQANLTYSITYHIQAIRRPCADTYTSLGVCDGHGYCRDDQLAAGQCQCLPCFSGRECTDVETCSENGLCNFTTGICNCHDGFTGDSCQFDGRSIEQREEILTGGGAALLAIGMFILGSIAGVVVLLVVNKKIRKAVYSEVSIQDRESFSKAVS